MTPINPFSKEYWSPAPSTQGLMEPPRVPLSAMKASNATVNGSNSTIGSFFGGSETSKPTPTNSSAAIKGFITNPEDLRIFRQEVEDSDLTKLGLIEVVHKRMGKSTTKAQVKASIESWAQHVGNKRADKRWKLTESCPV